MLKIGKNENSMYTVQLYYKTLLLPTENPLSLYSKSWIKKSPECGIAL